jgi:hypothetical protein
VLTIEQILVTLTPLANGSLRFDKLSLKSAAFKPLNATRTRRQ